MTSTVKPKAKFSSRNLSAVYKPPASAIKSTDNAGGFYPSANRMLVLGKSAMSSAPAPAPINTPSLRKEHYQAPAPTGSPARTGWAVPTAAVVTPLHLNPPAAETAGRASPARSPPPEQRPSSSENVWASGHVAEVINPELAHHPHPQEQQQQAAAQPESRVGSAGGGRAIGRFARSPLMSSSGRWGDDAVEQDIERRDREREARRHREFPDLKEAAQIEEQHHDSLSAGRATAPLRDHPAPRVDRFHREDDRFHRDDDRFHREDDRFRHNDRVDDSRRAWPARSEPSPAVGGGGAHSRFSPSDARFDGFVPRAAPSFGGGSSRAGSSRAGSSHGSVTSASELDVGHRYPSPPHYSFIPEDAHHHHDSPTSVAPVRPAHPPSVGPALPMQQAERHERFRSDSFHDEPMNWRQHPRPTPAPRAVPSVEQHERSNTSLSRASSSSSSADKPGGSAVQPATSSPQVRILKRVEAGPKMLFDPKTGVMVSADKEDANRRRRQQPKPAAEPVPSIETKPTEAVAVAKPVATLIVGDMELPIHHEPVMSLRHEAEPISEEQPASEATVEVVEEAVAPTVDAPTVEDAKKPNPRRREASEAKPNKPSKPTARPHERVKAEEHRSRSESTHKTKPKGEARHAASASPSVPLSTNSGSRSQQQEKRPPRGKRREDKAEERRSDRAVNADAEKKTERRAKTPRGDGAAPTKRETRSVATEKQPTASNGPSKPSRRAEKREAHAQRKQDESAATDEGSKSPESADSGFQTVKSRRVQLTEKKQQRQYEPSEETKAGASEEAGVSVRSQRKPRVRKSDYEVKAKAEPVAAVPTEAAASASNRNRRSERQAGGEQASEAAATPRHREPKQPRPSRDSKAEQGGAASKPRGNRDTPAPPRAIEAANVASNKQSGPKQTSDKRKPRREKAGKPKSERQARPTTAESFAPTESPAAVATAADPPSKTPGKQQRKPSVRKVYVVKATPAPALSAA